MHSYEEKRRKSYVVITISVIFILMAVFSYSKINAYEQKSGTVNASSVNVRTGAGTSYSKLLSSKGNNVQLNTGDTVTITGEKQDASGDKWYNIKFTYPSTGENLSGYIFAEYVNVVKTPVTDTSDFEKYMSDQGFPESYKVKLRQLHAKYQKWLFVADKLNYTFEDAVANESIVGRSLVSKNSISSWKSMDSGSYNWSTNTWNTFDGTAWCAASKEFVAYCMDPRNFLDENYIFQFEMLSYNSAIHTKNNVTNLLKGTFMDNAYSISGKLFSDTFMDAAAKSGVSPYHLVSRVIQEVGSAGTSGGVTGYYAPSTGNVYTNLYNFYNIKAYTANGRGAIENGLIYASGTDSTLLRPWNTKYKAVVGGAIFIGQGYINVGQDTIYYEKFDFAGTPYTHQYMTNVQAPKSESLKMAKAYSSDMKVSTSLVFKIPVYKNMPVNVSACPTDNSSPSTTLDSLSVDGYTLDKTFSSNTFEYSVTVPYEQTSVNISAHAPYSMATVAGTGSVSLNVGSNKLNITVNVGGLGARVYTLTINRQNKTQPQTETIKETSSSQETTKQSETSNPNPASYSTSYVVAGDRYIREILPQTSIDTLRRSFKLKNCTLKLLNANRQEQTGYVTTGTIADIIDTNGNLVKEYICLVLGDTDNDGILTVSDYNLLKNYLIGAIMLDEKDLLAADIDCNGNVNVVDLLYLKQKLTK